LIVTTANLDGKIKKACEIVKAAPESSVRLKEQELFKQVRNFYSYQPDKKIKSRFQYIKKLVVISFFIHLGLNKSFFSNFSFFTIFHLSYHLFSLVESDGRSGQCPK